MGRDTAQGEYLVQAEASGEREGLIAVEEKVQLSTVDCTNCLSARVARATAEGEEKGRDMIEGEYVDRAPGHEPQRDRSSKQINDLAAKLGELPAMPAQRVENP